MRSRSLTAFFAISLLTAAACSGSGTTGSGGGGGVGGSGSGNASTGNGKTVGTGNGNGTGVTSSGNTTSSTGSGQGGAGPGLKTVFVIMMENHSWSDIKGSASAPFINGTLLTGAAHAEAYKTPPANHPSEPNYVWLESGSNLGITDDNAPSANHQSTTEHLTTQLEAAGISWKAYAEGISGTDCPQADTGLFVVRHTPQLFFDDVTDGGSTTSAHCIQHVRPYTELKTDLDANTVPRFNFITPDLCHDMHGQTFGTMCFALTADLIKEGDTWLSTEVPMITGSAAFQNGGVLFVIWDEGTEPTFQTASDGPVPFFVLSPAAKAGYSSTVPYTHSSTLRSIQEIFGVTPFLRDAANATDLSDMFTSFP